MSWYYGTFACGHEGRVNVIGKTSERQWKIDKLFGEICEDCKAKEREAANNEAIESSKQFGFPELKGTEKQIGWANTIRMNFYNKSMDAHIIPDDIIRNETEAKFWIDNRNNLRPEFIETYQQKAEKKNINQSLVDMDTVKPAEVKYNSVVEIIKEGNRIALCYERNQEFIDLAKSYKYNWDGIWYRELSETTGSFDDRAAEIGNVLLKNGFCICIHDKNITETAIAGDYQKEHTRWIKSRADTRLLAINWKERDNELYKKARAIKGSEYSSPSVIVDVSHYKDVEKFAKENDFRFTKAAKAKIDNYIQQINSVKEVTVK